MWGGYFCGSSENLWNMKNVLVAICLVFSISAFANKVVDVPSDDETAKYEFDQVLLEPSADDLKDYRAEATADEPTLYLIDKLKACTYTREELVPGESLQRTVTHKVELFKAVNSIRKGLQKAERKGEVTAAEATRMMARVVRVALSAFYDDHSEAFEQALRDNRQDYRRQLAVFEGVILNG